MVNCEYTVRVLDNLWFHFVGGFGIGIADAGGNEIPSDPNRTGKVPLSR